MHKAKVVLVTPEDHDDIYEFLPTLFYLREKYEEVELNVISDRSFDSELSHLPFKVVNYVVAKKELGAIGSLKLAHKLTNLFNITHFYNYRSGIGAINFGRSLKATNRVGYKDPVGKLFYTKMLERNTGLAPSLQYLELVQEDESSLVNKVSLDLESKLPENFFHSKDHDPFIFMALGDLKQDDHKYILIKDILGQLTNQKVIMWSAEKNQHHIDLLEAHPNIIDATGVDYGQIHQYILTSQGIITDQLNVARLSTLIGVDHFMICREDYRQREISAFSFVLSLLHFDEKEIRYIEGAEQLKEMNQVHEVMDLIHEKFNL